MITIACALVIWFAFGWLPAVAFLGGGLVEMMTHRCSTREPSPISRADCERMTVEGER